MTLLSVMMVLSILALMGMSAARFALWGERLSQGERDLAVSFEAAESALQDAEWDVMGQSTQSVGVSTRHCDFAAAEFLTPGEGTDSFKIASTRMAKSVCGAGHAAGVCFDSVHPGQAWRQMLTALRNEHGTAVQNQTAAYGQFTGASWAAVGQGGLVPVNLVQPPRYVVEWAPLVAWDAEHPRYGWVVTAVGFGLNPATQTWLQVVLDKPGPSLQAPCAAFSRGPQTHWHYEVPMNPTVLPNHWRCRVVGAEDAMTSPSRPRACGRLSWRELNAGFSMVELMVAMVIWTIVSALAYPSYVHYLGRAKRMRCQTEVMLSMQAQERYKSEQRVYRLQSMGTVGDSPACEVGARACGSGGKTSLGACIEVFARPLFPNTDWSEMSVDSQGRNACVMADVRAPSTCWE